LAWDSRFPAPVWAAEQRPADPARSAEVAALLPALERGMIDQLSTRNF
jgi:hypothetical protein